MAVKLHTARVTSKSKRTARKGSDLNDLIISHNRLLRQVALMMPGVTLTDPGSKAGTTDAKTWRTEIFTFLFRGLNVTTAAQEKAFTGTTHDVAASKEAWFFLSVQSNGSSFTITKAADQTIGTQLLPTGPDNEVIVGVLQIITGATGWVANTDNLAADGAKIASYTFYDNEAPKLITSTADVTVTATTG